MWDLVSQVSSVGIVTNMCFNLYLAMAVIYNHLFLLVYVYLFFPLESEHENVCRPVLDCVGLTKSFLLYRQEKKALCSFHVYENGTRGMFPAYLLLC